MRSMTLLIFLSLLTTGLFGYQDTTRVARTTRQYTLNADYTEQVPVKMDTLITGFQDSKLINKLTPFYTSLGNYGLPVQEIDFFKTAGDPDNFLYRHYKPYMHHLGNKVFIDTQVPFSELIFTYGGKRTQAEQTLSVRHSQNVNQYLNFGLDLDVINSLGQYSYQSTDDRSFTLHTSYLGKKYQLFGAWSINNFTGAENGGLADETQLGQVATRDLPTRLGSLSDASTSFRYKDILLVQKYTIGGGTEVQSDTTKKSGSLKGTFTHILAWENGKRTYSDKLPSGSIYDSTYITGPLNNVPTFDSLFSRSFRNTVRFDFSAGQSGRFQVNVGAGIMHEMNLYSQIRPLHDDTFFADTSIWKHSSTAVLGKLSNSIGENFNWEASGRIYFAGYRAGDLELSGSMYKKFGKAADATRFKAYGGISGTTLSTWLSSWGSNHFEWDNAFNREYRVSVGGEIEFPALKMRISGDYALITDFTYFDEQAMPAQLGDPLSVMAIRLDKDFSFWKFRFNNRLVLQKSDHTDILDLPLLAAKSSFFLDHLFRFKVTDGSLGFQLGVEGVYNTAYYAPAFMPATGVFYNQGDIKTGNYPYLNAFLNLKLKRTRFFLMFEHLNEGLLGYDYQHVPGYLMPVRMFKYGISWTFYN